jgi:AcrR family transcriptional regulator
MVGVRGIRDTATGDTDEREPLSRDRLATTALKIIDAEGVAKLSMRRLGAELGVEAMSLYHYIDNKEDLLDAVVDVLYQEIELPDLADNQWAEGFVLAGQAFYAVLTRHPNAIGLVSSHSGRSPTTVGIIHWSWKRFQDAGLDETQAMIAFRSLVSYVLGFASTQVGVFGDSASNTLPIDVGNLEDPNVVRLVEVSAQLEPNDLFNDGLDLLVVGLRNRFGI